MEHLFTWDLLTARNCIFNVLMSDDLINNGGEPAATEPLTKRVTLTK